MESQVNASQMARYRESRDWQLEHDPEKSAPVLQKRPCSNKEGEIMIRFNPIGS
jgi:hypothetical protein